MIPDGLTPNRFKPVTSERKLEPLDDRDLSAGLVDVDLRFRRRHRLALAERVGLRDLRRLRYPHIERSVSDRDRRDLHVLSDHDCAGPRVDDDARCHVGLDHQLADLGHHAGDAEVARTKQLDRSPVALESEVPVILATGIGVDRVDDPHRRGVVGIPQLEKHLQFLDRRRRRQLDDRAIGNAARRGHALSNDFGLPRRVESRHGYRALRARINLAVGSHELRERATSPPSAKWRRRAPRR